jgi:hypothetical protein
MNKQPLQSGRAESAGAFTMDLHNQKVTLDNLIIEEGHSVTKQMFDVEFQKLLNNIGDPNTPAEVVRELKITIRVKPDNKRKSAAVTLSMATKIPGFNSQSSSIFLSQPKTDGTVDAFPNDPRQMQLLTSQPQGQEPS